MANGMFDVFTNRAGRLQMPTTFRDPRAELEEEHRRQRRLGLPLTVPNAVVAPTAPVGTSPDVPPVVTRPRIADVPPPPVQAPMSQEDDLQNRLRLARQQTDSLRDTVNNPVVNNDRGVLGRIGDILRQAVISAGEAYNNGSGDPEQRLMAAIGGGIAGGFGGGFKPTMDEERQRLYDINRSTQNEQRLQGMIDTDTGQRMKLAQIGAAEAEPIINAAKVDNTRAGIVSDELKANQKRVYDLWQQAVKSGGFKKSDPRFADLVLQAQQYNVPIFDAEEGDFFGSWSPDGRFAILDQKTGKPVLGFEGQKFEKPVTVSESDLDDSRFPWLKTEKDVQLQAQSEIAPELDKLEINPQTEADLLGYTTDGGQTYRYKNPDGSFNKNQFLQDTALGLAPMQYSNLYRGQTKSLVNKLARRQKELLDSQKTDRAELTKFKIALKGKPTSIANEAIDLFNAAMQSKNKKQRIAALKELYKQLS